MINLELDYRFGWRWLLPILHGDQVLLMGFTQHEETFWKQTLLDSVVTTDASKASVWLICELTPDCAIGLDSACLRSLCVVGSGKVIAAWHRWLSCHFSDVCDYTLLPSGKPRVVIPLGNSNWLMQGLTLHRPGRWVARVAIVLIKGLAWAGIDHLLRTRMVCIANKDVNIPPHGARQAGMDLGNITALQRFALYLGTSDDNRKTVILPLGRMRHTILKQGELPKAKASLRNEIDTLQAMNQTHLATQIPVLHNVVEKNGRVTLYQEYRPRKRVADAPFKKMAFDFLVGLSKLDRGTRPLADVLSEIRLMTSNDARMTRQMAYAKVKDHLDTLATAGFMIWGHRSHGDFAPWNCSWTEKGFFVFDWEESRPWDMALGDAFYLILAPRLNNRCSLDPALVELEVFTLGTDIVKAAGLAIEDVPVYWALWLLRRMNEKPTPLYQKMLVRLAASLF